MLDSAVRLGQLFTCASEDQVVRFWVVDLMPSPLRTCVNSQESYTLAKLTVDVATSFFNVWTWSGANDEAWVLLFWHHDERISQLH